MQIVKVPGKWVTCELAIEVLTERDLVGNTCVCGPDRAGSDRQRVRHWQLPRVCAFIFIVS